MKNFYEFVDTNREQFFDLLKSNEFKCNAAGRRFMAERVKVSKSRPVTVDMDTLRYAEEIGGLKPGSEFKYPNAQGGTSKAVVCSLYDLPKNMIHPFLYCFSGMMTAPLFAFEILRFYAKQTGRVLPFLSSGKEGNKGLFQKLFYREEGLIRKTEYDTYYKLMSLLTGTQYAYRNYTPCEDDDSEGNLIEIYNFAVSQGLKEVTFVICSGNPFYDKRLLAEWMWQLKQEKFAAVKVNLALAHCPIFLPKTLAAVPEAKISEIYLGYIAASLGPLKKDTVRFNGVTKSAKPERYTMPGVFGADWEKFRDIIVNYSNMGWPNYQEILYGIDHEEAVANIILSDLFARASYTPEEYDRGITSLLGAYADFIGGAYTPCSHGKFRNFLQNTPDARYFE